MNMLDTDNGRNKPECFVINNDCLNALKELPDSSVDSVVTDPPYGLANTTPAQVAETITRWVGGDRDYLPGGAGFMGKAWDAFVPPVAVWDECLRVLKPGGHVLTFAGSRTMDLMTLGLRLAGFDVRDSLAWLYGSGFPKSHDVSKAIDKMLGAERATVRVPASRVRNPKATGGGRDGMAGAERPWITAAMERGYHEKPGDDPATAEAAAWQGWGTALKPAFEPIIMARKPLDGTVAANVLAHGTGALNIDGCRIGNERRVNPPPAGNKPGGASLNMSKVGMPSGASAQEALGRWPANVVLDESQAAELDRQAPATGGKGEVSGASRFFYVSKATKNERPVVNGVAHPTVKPISLMRNLVRLVTPPNGFVLDPFAGSGTTIEAAILEGFNSIGIERDDSYIALIDFRIARAMKSLD